MSGKGFQLSTFLYGLGGGRRRVPAPPALIPDQTGYVTATPGQVNLVSHQESTEPATCLAVQQDPTSCGPAAAAVALSMVNLDVARWLSGQTEQFPPRLETALVHPGAPAGPAGVQGRFSQLQSALKTISNRRGLWPFTWPNAAGTPPWGAARVMSQGTGVRYIDRMIVNTSMRQRTQALTAAATAVDRGFPVLLYTGGDTKMGWSAAVPRHVVVLHRGEAPEPEMVPEPTDLDLDLEAKLTAMAQQIKEKLKAANPQVFDPELVIYEPGTGTNTAVTLSQLVENEVPAHALGGWPHLVWMVLPVASKKERS